MFTYTTNENTIQYSYNILKGSSKMDLVNKRKITSALKECGITHEWVTVAMTKDSDAIESNHDKALEAISIIASELNLEINLISNTQFFIVNNDSVTASRSYQHYVDATINGAIVEKVKQQDVWRYVPYLNVPSDLFDLKKEWPFGPQHSGLRVTTTDGETLRVCDDGLGTFYIRGHRPQIKEGLSAKEVLELNSLGITKWEFNSFGSQTFRANTTPTLEMAKGLMDSATFLFWRGNESFYGDIVSPDGYKYSFGRNCEGEVYIKQPKGVSPDVDLGEWLDH